MVKIKSSEITPKDVYVSRRQFIKGVGALTAGAIALAACGGGEVGPTSTSETNGATPTIGEADTPQPTQGMTDELGTKITQYESAINYNNFYEFTISKERVAKDSKDFVTSPWQVEVGGLVNNPKVYDIDDLMKFEQEERIYRMRCVEGWSMVLPWIGFPLSKILNEVEPTSDAKYVRFETLYDPERMPGQKSKGYVWPYVEGLRMDEAMHDLTILAISLYGESLLPQNGAPVRLAVPWKYGFKSIKSIVKIDLVEFEPISLWMNAAPHEYGFFANVNPEVDHPRWSQSSERRIGELGRIPTLMFNGYEEEVAHLYAGMDLKKNY
jgi:sulfoxide reductase catalytic subunit YedY